jgi:hypothetical protein
VIISQVLWNTGSPAFAGDDRLIGAALDRSGNVELSPFP